MTNEQKFIVSLIRKSFNLNDDAACQFSGQIEEKRVIQIIKSNGVLLTVYPTLSKLQNFGTLSKKLEQLYLATIKQSVNQSHEGQCVLEHLSQSGFDCIALKGWENRSYYPNPNMRQMVDVDILVRPYKFELIKEIMEKLDFSCGKESSWKHDSFRKGNIHIEMHKRLTDDSDKIQQWETEMWNRAIPYQNHVYKMAIEDFYLFHFIHLYKDFLNGSLGLRRIIDTWLLTNQTKNEEFITNELKRFGLITFHSRMVSLAKALMGEEELDENSEILLTHAFYVGIFGNGKSYKVGRIVAMSGNRGIRVGKIRSWVSAVFLPVGRMKAQFPIIEKWPVLLPYYWIKRIIHYLRGNMQKNKQMLDYRSVSDADYSEMKAFFKAGGEM